MPPGFLARVWAWVAQARAHRVLCLVGGLWVISLFDLALTLIAHREGLLDEANPVAALVLDQGPGLVCLYKGGLVIVGSAILIRYRRRFITEFAAAGLLMIYTLVAVQWKWCYELYELAHTGGVSDVELLRVGTWASEMSGF